MAHESKSDAPDSMTGTPKPALSVKSEPMPDYNSDSSVPRTAGARPLIPGMAPSTNGHVESSPQAKSASASPVTPPSQPNSNYDYFSPASRAVAGPPLPTSPVPNLEQDSHGQQHPQQHPQQLAQHPYQYMHQNGLAGHDGFAAEVDAIRASAPPRSALGNGMTSQQPLPTAFPPSAPTGSGGGDSMDVDNVKHVRNGSCDDGANGKRKKRVQQRFYCQGFENCNLSFTRSEHLARHIRKHTGERPFTCHCGRNFSRLDNLRQHAQTVHHNEDIPEDSLANSARHPRQSKFERKPMMVQVVDLANQSALGNMQRIHHIQRGHGRSRSSSSIIDMPRSMAAARSLYTPNDLRHPRPPQLITQPPPPGYMPPHPDAGPSPNHHGPPLSATSIEGPNWMSRHAGISHSRSQSLNMPIAFNAFERRLSVPGAGGMNEAQVAGPPPPGPNGYFHPGPNGSFEPRMSSEMDNSPRRDFMTDEQRRRTWHPDSQPRAIHDGSRPDQAWNGAAMDRQPQNIRLPSIRSVMARELNDPRFSPRAADVGHGEAGMPGSLATISGLSISSPTIQGSPHLAIDPAISGARPTTSASRHPDRWASMDEANSSQAADRRQALGRGVRFDEEPVMPSRRRGPTRPLHQHTMSAPSSHFSTWVPYHSWDSHASPAPDSDNSPRQHYPPPPHSPSINQPQGLVYRGPQQELPFRGGPPHRGGNGQPMQPSQLRQTQNASATGDARPSYVSRLEHPNLAFDFPARGPDAEAPSGQQSEPSNNPLDALADASQRYRRM